MTQEQANTRLAENMWSAMASGDAGLLSDVLAADVVWETHGDNPYTGEFKGRAAVFEWLARVGDGADEFVADFRDLFANASGVVIHFHMSGRRGPKTLESDVLLMLRMSGHTISRINCLPVDQPTNDEFWSWAH